MKDYRYFLNENDNNKIILIRKKYVKEYKNLEKLGEEVFDYIWTEDEPFDKIKELEGEVIWYRGPIEDEKWRKVIRSIEDKNTILNHPDLCIKSAIKSEFYEDIQGMDFAPKVWLDPKDAEFPCVEKPNNGHSGKGIRVVDSIDDVDTKNGDLWMEKIDFDSEWRVWCYEDKALGTFYRKHITGIEDKKTDDTVEFEYIEKDMPNMDGAQKILDAMFKKYKLNFSAVDLFHKDGKWWVCEINAQPGYKESIWKKTIKHLKNNITK